MQEERDVPTERGVDRRKMLRRTGAVIAGTAAAGVAGAVSASPAQADDGQPLLLGADNTATTTTKVTIGDLGQPAVALTNTATSTGNGYTSAGPSLQLTPSGDVLSAAAPVGSLAASTDGVLWRSGGPTYGAQFLYDSSIANMLVPIKPQRVIDTRDPALRVRVVTPDAFDSQGRPVVGKEIVIDLSDFSDGATAVYGNLTSAAAERDGWVQVYPYGTPRPANFSNLNFTKNLYALSNSFVSGVGAWQGPQYLDDAISIYVSAPTHLIIDIVAFQAFGWGAVNPVIWPGGSAAAGSRVGAAAQATSKPRTYRYKKF